MANWDNSFSRWDDGETWDAGQSPNPGDVTPYLNLITSEHNDKPNFMAMLTGIFQPLADGLAVANSLYLLYDIDNAAGIQLDAVGKWVGASRQLKVPITDVFFTFDDGPGFDRGVFKGPFDPSDSLVSLPDEQYRTLLYATIAANHWDGTIPGAYAAYAIIFGPGGYRLLIIDNQNMTMDLVLIGPTPDAITLQLFIGGYLSLKPDGVRISNYIVVPDDVPAFMFDVTPDSPVGAGFDVGAFPTFYPGV